MVGVLAANGSVDGGARGVRVLVGATLGENSRGEDVADEDLVADAIDWCIAEDADLLSLSLGGETMRRNLATITTSAVDRALDSGMFVIAREQGMMVVRRMTVSLEPSEHARRDRRWGGCVQWLSMGGLIRRGTLDMPACFGHILIRNLRLWRQAWPSSPRRRMECSDRASARPCQPCSLRLGSPTSSRLTRGSRRRAATHGVALMCQMAFLAASSNPMSPELSMIEHGGTGRWMCQMDRCDSRNGCVPT